MGNLLGIYEYLQPNGKWYVGATPRRSLLDRLNDHLRPGDRHPIANPNEIVWTVIPEGGKSARIAESIRSREIAVQIG